MDVLLDHADAKPRDAVRIIFAKDEDRTYLRDLTGLGRLDTSRTSTLPRTLEERPKLLLATPDR